MSEYSPSTATDGDSGSADRSGSAQQATAAPRTPHRGQNVATCRREL